MADASAFEGDLGDVGDLLQVADEIIDAAIGVASTCNLGRVGVLYHEAFEPDVIGHALRDASEQAAPIGIHQAAFELLELR